MVILIGEKSGAESPEQKHRKKLEILLEFISIEHGLKRAPDPMLAREIMNELSRVRHGRYEALHREYYHKFQPYLRV